MSDHCPEDTGPGAERGHTRRPGMPPVPPSRPRPPAAEQTEYHPTTEID